MESRNGKENRAPAPCTTPTEGSQASEPRLHKTAAKAVPTVRLTDPVGDLKSSGTLDVRGGGSRESAIIPESRLCFVDMRHGISPHLGEIRSQENWSVYCKISNMEVSESNSLSCKALLKEAIYIERRLKSLCTSVSTDPLIPTLVFSQNSVPKLRPYMELAKFAGLGFTRGHLLHIESHYQKLPYEIGILLITRLLPGPSVEYRRRYGFCVTNNYVFF